MAEKPIIFSASMVKAIQAGTKTQTRRPLKPQPTYVPGGESEFDAGDFWQWKSYCWLPDEHKTIETFAQYRPGDVLYVKEAWTSYLDTVPHNPRRCTNFYIYKADPIFDTCTPGDIDWKWESAIYMPKSAARIFLEVTEVRVERLWDITEDDAKAEGVTLELPTGLSYECYCSAFAALWNYIYRKKPKLQWDKYPWVWVISFKKIDRPEV